MLWKFFGSELRVQEALEKSIGFNISPNVIINLPVNSDIPARVTTDCIASPSASRYLSKLPQE